MQIERTVLGQESEVKAATTVRWKTCANGSQTYSLALEFFYPSSRSFVAVVLCVAAPGRSG
jgi:hypothetical protein